MNIELFKEYKDNKSIKNDDYFNNHFFNLLNNVMNNEEFRELMKNYGKTWLDVKTLMMYIKSYEFIENLYYSYYGHKADKDLLIFILQNIFREYKVRHQIVESFHEFTKDISSKSFIELLMEKYKLLNLENSEKKIIKNN